MSERRERVHGWLLDIGVLFLGMSAGWGLARGEPRWAPLAFLAVGVLLGRLARYLRRRDGR